jgi:excisionase family DNA binding protein
MTELTLVQAGERLGLRPGTLRMAIHRGRLKGRKVGFLWVVSVAELNRYRDQSWGHRGRPRSTRK